jgi:biotin carboxylase
MTPSFTPTIPSRALLLSSGPPLSLKALYCLNAIGFEADLIDLREPSMARYSRYRSRYLRLDPPADEADHARLAELLQSMRDRRYATVIPCDIFSAGLLYDAAPLVSTLPIFPTSSFATLNQLDDKWAFHQLLLKQKLPTPDGMLVTPDESDDPPAVSDDWYPLLIKPLEAESGHGIVRVDDAETLARQLRGIAHEPVMLQKFVEGSDLDVSLIAVDGQIKAHVVQSRSTPGALRFTASMRAVELACRVIESTRYTGVANIDMRISAPSGEILILECNPRLWFTLHASAWRGINFVELGVRLARGDEIYPTTPESGLYYLHGHLLRHMAWKPTSWRHVNGYNLRGLWQALSDPGPQLFKLFRSPG